MHKKTVCKVLNIFQYGKYLVAYVLKMLHCLKSHVAAQLLALRLLLDFSLL